MAPVVNEAVQEEEEETQNAAEESPVKKPKKKIKRKIIVVQDSESEEEEISVHLPKAKKQPLHLQENSFMRETFSFGDPSRFY